MPTAIVKSIGSRVGRDYATPQAFEDAIPADITAAGTDETWTGECYNDSEFTTGTTFSGTSADVTHWIKLTTATGQSFIDHADKLTNALTYDQTKGVAINVSGSYTNGIRLSNAENITIEKLQINRTNASGNNRAIFADGTGANKLVQNVIVKTSESGSEGIQIYGGKVNNTLIICTATNTTGLFLRNGSEANFVTVVSPSDVTSTVIGIDGQYTNNIVKNCVSFGFGTDFESGVWAASSDYNASDGTGSPGANSVDSLTFADQFEVVTTTGMDFRAKSGNDLQAGVADLTLDIIGQTRADPPTIGAWEFVSGGGGSDATGNVTLPSLTLSGAALVAYLASGASTFPSLQFGGTAAVANSATTSGQIDLPSLTASGFALLTQNASGVFSLPSLSVTGSSDTAYLSAGGVTLPSLTTSGVAAAAVLGQAVGHAILPQLILSGVGLIALNASGSFTLPQILLAGEASGPVLGGGAIRVINSTDLAEYVNASVSYQEGIIAVDDVGTDLHPSNGIYYVSNQRIAVSFGVSVSRIAGGIPFTSAGRIAMSTSPVSYYANNLPFTANGQIAVSQVSNVIRCSDIVSCTDIIPCGG
jgi:hypothetical protein